MTAVRRFLGVYCEWQTRRRYNRRRRALAAMGQAVAETGEHL